MVGHVYTYHAPLVLGAADLEKVKEVRGVHGVQARVVLTNHGVGDTQLEFLETKTVTGEGKTTLYSGSTPITGPLWK